MTSKAPFDMLHTVHERKRQAQMPWTKLKPRILTV